MIARLYFTNNILYGNFLGTDFTVENIVGEVLSDYQYKRRNDRDIKNVKYFIIDAYRQGDDMASMIKYGKVHVDI